MNELELLIDFHKDAERQGPGSTADTLKALSFLNLDESQHWKVADIGCGSGAQTITLAEKLGAEIIAVDLFPDFLEKLNHNANKLGLEQNIRTLEKSMDNLSFSDEEFDLIWSEGAIYNMGFEAGIKNWKKFLKTGGFLGVSEITWLSNCRPQELEAHWKQEYPEIDTASGKIKTLEENGFSPIGYFYLSPEAWLNNYYLPIEARFDAFLEKHQHSETAKNIVKAEKEEIRLYRKYQNFISYGFYIAKKLVDE